MGAGMKAVLFAAVALCVIGSVSQSPGASYACMPSAAVLIAVSN